MPPKPANFGSYDRATVILYCAATTFALSPIVVDLCRHWIQEPTLRYSAIFVPLSVWWLRVAPRLDRPNRDGLLWLTLALLLVIVTVGGGVLRWGRPAIPLAVIGLCRLLGGPRLSAALLTVFLVPVPAFVGDGVSPMLPRLLLALAAPVSRLITGGPGGSIGELEWQQQAFEITGARGVLQIDAMDAGLSVVALMAGLGWLAALIRGEALPLSRSARWAALGLPIQLVGLVLALACLELFSARISQGLLAHGVWLAAATLGLVVALKARPNAQ